MISVKSCSREETDYILEIAEVVELMAKIMSHAFGNKIMDVLLSNPAPEHGSD